MSPRSSPSSTAYINGNVFTAGDNLHAEAFTVSSDGTFAKVGKNDEVLEIAKKEHLPIYDLRDQFVMPGIHDAHVHLLYAGYAMLNEADLGLETSLEKVRSQLKHACCSCAYTNVYEDWIIANGFNIENFDRATLDEDYPDIPVIIRAQAGHAMYANTEALKRSGIEPEKEPDQLPSRYIRRKDGSLTGELHETAMNRVHLAIPYPSRTHAKRCLRRAIDDLHAAGVTSLQEAATNTIMLEALRELDQEEALKIDIAAHIVHTPEFIGWETSDSLLKLLDNAAEYKTKHVDTRFLKVILDGVPLHPLYSHGDMDANGKPNMEKLTHRDIASVVEEFDKRGVTCKVHCTGHGSTRIMLDAIEKARKKNPGGPRHEVAHNSGVHDDDYSRYAGLNCTAEMSPSFLFRHPMTMASDLMDWNFAKMIQNKAHITIGSDWAGTMPPSVLEHCAQIYEDVDGASSGRGGEALCKMLTINGAQAVGHEKEVGSIEIGKKANFIVVNQDLAKGKFAGSKVLKTWFEGELVFEDTSKP